MVRPSRPLILCVALLLVGAGFPLPGITATAMAVDAPAQSPAFDDPELDALWVSLMRLRYDTPVRVDLYSNSNPLGGWFQFATEQDVVVDNFGQEVRVPLQDVREVWRAETRRGRSLVIGGMVGVISGVAITAIFLNAEVGGPGSGERIDTGTAVFLGASLGAVLGFTFGGMVAGEDEHWVREYPEP